MRCVRAPKGPHKGNVTSLGLVRREKDYEFERTLSDNSGKTMPEARAGGRLRQFKGAPTIAQKETEECIEELPDRPGGPPRGHPEDEPPRKQTDLLSAPPKCASQGAYKL